MELLLFWLVFAIACAVVASSKNRSGFGWFMLGLLFSFIALIVVAVLPALEGGPKQAKPPLSYD